MTADLKRHFPVLALGALLIIGLFAPLVLKLSAPGFWMEVLLGGLMAGVLYSLVALGFVLIFKASGVFNFAQGAMVLFAALAVARLSERMPLWVAIILAIAIMIALAMIIERLVLRPLVNQEAVTLLMATLGVAYFLDGIGQTLWGSDIYKIDLGIAREPVMILDNVVQGGILINRDDVAAAIVAIVLVGALAVFFQKTATGRALRAVADDHQAAQSIGIPLNRIWVIVWSVAGVVAIVAGVVAGALVIVLALFFQKTRTGRALRAVADDHQAAQSVGIPLNRIWVIVWSVAGLVALVAGVIWGSKLGVQFSLQQVALKALPVVILGGFTSIPGAIIGGLIIGLGEKLSEVYVGPMVGGGIEIWFAYVLALLFLLVRPQGLFGEKIIDRV